jgi:hypothetical protein
MTVSTTIIKSSHNGNGSTTTFAYNFKIFADTDLVVIIRSSTGTETTKTLTTHYTVAGAGDASGGSITFTSGNIPASGETVVIRRNVPQTQAIDYIANDPFPAETNEEGLDRSTMIAQQVSEEADRSIKLSRTNTMTSTEFTVGATDRANKILAFDGSGEISVTQELGSFKGDWSSGTAYVARDLVKDTSTNNIFIVNEAHTSSGSQPLTSNANSAKYDLIVDAVQLQHLQVLQQLLLQQQLTQQLPQRHLLQQRQHKLVTHQHLHQLLPQKLVKHQLQQQMLQHLLIVLMIDI